MLILAVITTPGPSHKSTNSMYSVQNLNNSSSSTNLDKQITTLTQIFEIANDNQV